jgi:hypothetical protein
MKRLLKGLLIMASTTRLVYCNEFPRFDVSTDVGVSIMWDFELGGRDLTFDPGMRFDIVPQLRLTPQFAVEFNTGVIWNTFGAIESIPLKGDHFQIPALLQGVWTVPLQSNTKPFLGVAAGGVYDHSMIDTFNGNAVLLKESGLYPAFQGVAGAEWQLTDRLVIGIVYKYLYVHTQEHFSLPDMDVNSNGTKTQSVSLRMRYEF